MTVHPRLMSLMLTQAGIPEKYRGLSLDDFKPTREQGKAYVASRAFVAMLRDRYVSKTRPLDQYPSDRSLMGRGLLLAGPAGTGKTTLAALTVQQVFMEYRLPAFFTAYAEVVQNSIDLIRAEKRNDEDEMHRAYQFMHKVYDIPVLALDDVGKERRTGSGYAEDEFDRLLRWRFRNSRPTIITTNLRSEDWAKIYNPSMGSFINEAFDRFDITGKDLRGEG